MSRETITRHMYRALVKGFTLSFEVLEDSKERNGIRIFNDLTNTKERISSQSFEYLNIQIFEFDVCHENLPPYFVSLNIFLAKLRNSEL